MVVQGVSHKSLWLAYSSQHLPQYSGAPLSCDHGVALQRETNAQLTGEGHYPSLPPQLPGLRNLAGSEQYLLARAK